MGIRPSEIPSQMNGLFYGFLVFLYFLSFESHFVLCDDSIIISPLVPGAGATRRWLLSTVDSNTASGLLADSIIISPLVPVADAARRYWMSAYYYYNNSKSVCTASSQPACRCSCNKL